MVTIENNQIFSTEGKYIHRVGADTYFKRSTVLPADSVSDYEEVNEIPGYTRVQYESKVVELIREKYSDSEEFALQRKAINAAFSPSELTMEYEKTLNEYAEYNTFVEECKIKAKDPELYKIDDYKSLEGKEI